MKLLLIIALFWALGIIYISFGGQSNPNDINQDGVVDLQDASILYGTIGSLATIVATIFTTLLQRSSGIFSNMK